MDLGTLAYHLGDAGFADILGQFPMEQAYRRDTAQ